jgi:hypothetical protein
VTIATLIPWRELLSRRFNNVTDQYGPHSQVVASAMMTIGDTRWLEHVGEPWMESASEPPLPLTLVKSWDEALMIFNDFPRYNINGVLQAACDPIDKIYEDHRELDVWWQKARQDAKEYSALMGWIPRSLSDDHQDLMFENLWEFVSMLLAEIIVSDKTECTYFREQLAWFHAGHFPCGWDGAWPNGHMKVY